jgi:predicted O-methyltransferase YrrM
MRGLIKYLLERLPLGDKLYKVERTKTTDYTEYGAFPPGHYYSPIPSKEEVLAYLESSKKNVKEVLDVNLNKEFQREILEAFQTYYQELPFVEEPNQDSRYYFSQPWFCYADAIFLYCFLRHINPKRVIEVGSGFSSAVMLDTVDKFLSQKPEITFIEPYPERLKSILKPKDYENCQILESRVQEVPLSVFGSLCAGDLLFIDSSHVVKSGSDLQFLMFEVLPRLPVGVFVHFHDIFYPFEYPDEWVLEGRYWNENYFLRAFLAYNNQWDIYFFNTYVDKVFNDFIAEKMPLCIKNPGGSIYLLKRYA